ncbi:Katanin p80 WD40 repeat-containing subunit B1, partial [Fasciolopsis buskii]
HFVTRHLQFTRCLFKNNQLSFTLLVVRALSGHTSGISSLDFHPFGNFVTSGSVDSLVKLWDVSRKGCINTYRGHSGGVNMVRFSPDGKWVVSGGEDGLVKLWDLSAGRLLAELPGHTGPVTAVAFHPTVLLLATASADRTVRLFDLENFTQIAMSGTELNASVIRRIAFHPDGVCLYVANIDYLKIYDYENMACLETVHVGWRTAGGLDDMAIAPSFNQLVGASISNSLVSTYVVDIKSCVPFSDNGISASEVSGDNPCSDPTPAPVTTSNVIRRENQLNNDRPYTRCGSSNTAQNARNRKSFCLSADDNRRNILQEDPTDPESHLPYNPTAEDQFEMNTVADITDPEEYDRVFKPHRSVPRSPTRSNAVSSTTTTTTAVASPSIPDTRRPSPPTVHSQPQPKASPPVRSAQSSSDRIRSTGQSAVHLNDKRPVNEVPFSPPEQEVPRKFVPQQLVNKPKRPPSESGQAGICDTEQLIAKFTPNPDNSRLQDAVTVARGSPTTTEPTESEWLVRARRPHGPFMSVMTARLKALSTVRVMWTRDNTRTAVETALTLNEPAVLTDLLGVLSQNESKYNTHVETTCQALRVILKNFAQLIRQTLDGPSLPGVDLMREERQRKCRDCLDHLLAIRSALDAKEVATKAGQYGRELLVLFELLV